MTLPAEILSNRYGDNGAWLAWDTRSVHDLLTEQTSNGSIRTTERSLESSDLLPATLEVDALVDEFGRHLRQRVLDSLLTEAKAKRFTTLLLQEYRNDRGLRVLFSNDLRGGRRWVYLQSDNDIEELGDAIKVLAEDRNVLLLPGGPITASIRALQERLGSPHLRVAAGKVVRFGLPAYHEPTVSVDWQVTPTTIAAGQTLSNLDRLEAESIYILREVVAQAKNPAMLFSLGKDSCVMLHLARKAFYPSPPPFPLVHVDTRWKFKAMYEFRDEVARSSGMDMIVHVNPEAVEKNINPFDHGSELHTHITKTEGLKQVLNQYKIDVALGGARRDEEKSRAKERVFSIRNSSHRWDPKRQRPELWSLYNGYKAQGESIRAFPLSDWTELDIWQYIYREQIPIIPLYYAAYRPVVERDGMLMLVDDDRAELFENETIQIKKVRFRTLGCYPLTGAIESDADDLPSIVLELLQSRSSERQGRVIDKDSNASMEKKKQEGYF
ncbi:MAG: sulfate adenylyltransferase subunit CysD [Gammaproteobacteria bacterium]|nr:sulfate adenylyltransferase subunit CysD [Pseudomonadales bacterium]MCP5346620.1 sulfate adenylyltransferase subunit CysD [Pseudomonadales bacterium]